MQAYAQALTYAIPGFVVLIILEALAARVMGLQINRGMDTIASLSSGVTNLLKSLLGLSITIVSYQWLEARIGLFEIQASWLLYVLAFIGQDFAGYWSHRFNHSVNLFWNRHVVHHSSDEFNLSCALRQEMSAFVNIYFFLYVPMAVAGIPSRVIAVVGPIHLFAQFWYHTRLINRMGFLEQILVTPSHHRVHHAVNEIYLDKNLSQIFIVWDKLFGTFQEELAEEPPVYGTLTSANSWNPVVINFSHVARLAQDAWRAERWWDKLRIWFMPLGWRPMDVAEKFPLNRPALHERTKYEPEISRALHVWSWCHFVLCMLLMYHMLITIGTQPYIAIAWYAGYLFASICSYTLLMERNSLALAADVLRTIVGVAIIVQFNGWFGLEANLPAGRSVCLGVVLIPLFVTIKFLWPRRKSELAASR